MENSKGIYQTIGSAVLLLTLACTAAYVFSQESIFRPPTSRTRIAPGSKLAENKAESAYGESGDREVYGRLQAQELRYIMK